RLRIHEATAISERMMLAPAYTRRRMLRPERPDRPDPTGRSPGGGGSGGGGAPGDSAGAPDPGATDVPASGGGGALPRSTGAPGPAGAESPASVAADVGAVRVGAAALAPRATTPLGSVAVTTSACGNRSRTSWCTSGVREASPHTRIVPGRSPPADAMV